MDAENTLHPQALKEAGAIYEATRTGALFYLAAWLLIGGFSGAFTSNTTLAIAIALGFMGLHAARQLPPPARYEALKAWQKRFDFLAPTPSLLWAPIAVWSSDPSFDGTLRSTLWICTVAFATAMAHAYGGRPALAILGISLVYLPGLLALWLRAIDLPLAIGLSVYFLYLCGALKRSVDAHRRRIALETELQVRNQELLRLSVTDALTGLANRRHLNIQADAALARSTHESNPVSLLLIDIDHFKAINDSRGHAGGDDALIDLARCLESSLSGVQAIVARVGGEEFAVLLERTPRTVALRHAVGIQQTLESKNAGITLSIGVAEQLGGELTQLLRRADRALYAAKAAGRNAVRMDA